MTFETVSVAAKCGYTDAIEAFLAMNSLVAQLVRALH